MIDVGRIDMSKLENLAKLSGIGSDELEAKLVEHGLSGVAFATGTFLS